MSLVHYNFTTSFAFCWISKAYFFVYVWPVNNPDFSDFCFGDGLTFFITHCAVKLQFKFLVAHKVDLGVNNYIVTYEEAFWKVKQTGLRNSHLCIQGLRS